MPTVVELAADPALRLRVAAGRRGLEREVTAAAVSELVEPGPWLQGGELLLTIGLLLPADRYGEYVAHLDAAGVPALGLGLGEGLRHQTVPEALATACEAAGCRCSPCRTGCRSSPSRRRCSRWWPGPSAGTWSGRWPRSGR